MTKILDGGDASGRLNLILVSEGFRAQDMRGFRDKADELADVIRSEPWYSDGLLNIHILEVPSREPAWWLRPDGKSRDTAFGAHYGGGGKVERLISGKDALVRATVEEAFKDIPRHTGVLVNSRRHGGNGGYSNMFWTSTGTGWTNTALHELGHSFGELCDEYGDDTGRRRRWPAERAEPKCPNVSKDGLKWAQITRTKFEGAKRHDKGLFRPFQRCRMRDFSGRFCAVCEDAFLRKLESYMDELPVVTEPIPDPDLEIEDPVVGPRETIAVQAGGDSPRIFDDTSHGTGEAVQYLLERRPPG